MNRWLALGFLGLLIAAPLALRQKPPPAPAGAKKLVIITPHGEHIRHEFALAFSRWARQELGVAVTIDWRTPGGTGDIIRYLNDRYRAEFIRALPEHAQQSDTFSDTKSDKSTDPAVQAARAAWLASDIGVGVDLFFGGGEIPYRQLASRGLLVDAGLVTSEPDWFTPAVIPQELSGETIYDPQGRYYGACLGVFGIAVNPQQLAVLSVPAPTGWSDLGTADYRAQLTLTDPTRSGAAITAFERLLQEQMALHPDDLGKGWQNGLALILRLVGNARSITDSASKPTRDVVRGDCLAAMALDFQAKFEAENAERESRLAGTATTIPRLQFITPIGGTSVSADPIGLLRGAPEHDLAVAFIRFVLSPDGQRLWNYRVGTPGGPERYALRRLPVRRDVLDQQWALYASDPDEDPFVIGSAFTYRYAWTGPLRDLMGPLIKAIALDCRDELREAWHAILDAGGPQAVPQAYATFSTVPVTYADAPAALATLRAGPEQALPLLRQWTTAAIARFARATADAKAGR